MNRPANATVAAMVALSLTIAACTHSQAWVASGESLDALGRTFLTTGQALDAAYDAKLVSEADYSRWRAFVPYFQATYDVAADRWLHADDGAAEHAAAVLAALSAELATFAAMGAP